MSADTPSRVSPSATETKDLTGREIHVRGVAADEELLRTLRQEIRSSGESDEVRLFSPFAGLVADALDRWLPRLPPRSPSSPVPSSPPEWAHEDFIRDMPSRGTEPEDFEKLLETLISKSIVRGRDAGQQGRLIYGGIESRQKAVDEAAAAIRGYVSRLQSENDALREQFYDLQQDSSDNDLALRSQLSRIQQTGLTAEEASKAWNAVAGYGPASHPDYNSLRDKLDASRREGR